MFGGESQQGELEVILVIREGSAETSPNSLDQDRRIDPSSRMGWRAQERGGLASRGTPGNRTDSPCKQTVDISLALQPALAMPGDPARRKPTA